MDNDFHIREMVLSDIPKVADLIEKTGGHEGRPFNREAFLDNVLGLVVRGDMKGLIASDKSGDVHGAIVYAITRLTVDGSRMAVEFVWRVDEKAKGFGVRMLKAFEEHAKKHGCASVLIAHSDSKRRTADIFDRLGYIRGDVNYRKWL